MYRSRVKISATLEVLSDLFLNRRIFPITTSLFNQKPSLDVHSNRIAAATNLLLGSERVWATMNVAIDNLKMISIDAQEQT